MSLMFDMYLMINKFYKLFSFHGLRGKNHARLNCLRGWLILATRETRNSKPSHTPDASSLWWSNSRKTSRTSIFQEINNKIFYKLNDWVLTICFVGAGWVVIQMFEPYPLPFCFPRRHFKMQISFIAKA